MAADGAAQQRDAFAGRLFEATLGAMDLLALYVGDRLGLYRSLAEYGPSTSVELAGRGGLNERYVREWLEQQAVGGVLEVEDVSEAPSTRRYLLPPGHREVLLDGDSLSYLGPLGRFVAALGAALPDVVTAFRTGGGVPWSTYGADGREAQAALNRPVFLNLLGKEWLPAIPEVHHRLTAAPPARVADIGCGGGWSSIAIARAYPLVHVDGFDVDGPSIDIARANAGEAGLTDRVSFHVQDAGDPALSGRYDLVTAFEMIHDLFRPVDVLRTMRQLLAPGGVALVMDERVGEEFTAPGDPVERLFYGFSILCCLPVGLSESPSAGTGTVMRPGTLRGYALEAGFKEMEVLSIEHDLFRFYRLLP